MKSLPTDNIHQRLCDLRNGTGKTQKEVADELNIQASVLSRIERGETKAVSHDLVIKFAEYIRFQRIIYSAYRIFALEGMWNWKNWD